MIRFAVIGSGWRSLFYVRIARALPDMFELTALLCRGQEKADRIQNEYGIHTTTSEDEIIAICLTWATLYLFRRSYVWSC